MKIGDRVKTPIGEGEITDTWELSHLQRRHYIVRGVWWCEDQLTPLEEPLYEPPKGRVCHFPKPCAGGVQSCMDCEWRFDVAAYAERLRGAWPNDERILLSSRKYDPPNPESSFPPEGMGYRYLSSIPKPNPLFICDHAGECPSKCKAGEKHEHPHPSYCPKTALTCCVIGKPVECIPYEEKDWFVVGRYHYPSGWEYDIPDEGYSKEDAIRRAQLYAEGKGVEHRAFRWSEGIQ